MIGRGDAFYRALHEGRSRDGRMLYPAFPSPELHHAGDARGFRRDLRLPDEPRGASASRQHCARADIPCTIVHWRWQCGGCFISKPASLQVDTSAVRCLAARRLPRAGPCALRCPPQHPQRARRTARRPRLRRRDDAAERLVCAVADLRATKQAMADWPLQDIARWLQSGTARRRFGPMAEIVSRAR